jgi:hypothetical protein
MSMMSIDVYIVRGSWRRVSLEAARRRRLMLATKRVMKEMWRPWKWPPDALAERCAESAEGDTSAGHIHSPGISGLDCLR